MACSKYTLTNTGSTVVNFNYRRCDDSMWEYQVELSPNQTKNVWLINNSYSTAFAQNIVLVDDGAFPPTGPTPTPTQTSTTTPTPTVTSTVTSTQTPTPSTTASLTPTPTTTASLTPTPTETPTSTPSETPTNTPSATSAPTVTPTTTQTPTPTHTRFMFSVYSGTTSNEACANLNSSTIYGDNLVFDLNSQFYNSLTESVSVDMTGFYNNSGTITQLTSGGIETGGFYLCSIVPTPTPTITQTPSPTPTFAFYTYSLGTGSTSSNACSDFSSAPNTIYGTVSGGIGPNVGEYLYFDTILSIPVIDGYYSNGVAWYNVSGGLGQITSSDPNGC